MNAQTERAAFNLAQLEGRPNWYEHLDQVENAMKQAAEDWQVRKDYGWDGDDGGEWGPDPLNPDENILEQDWVDTTMLSYPEDFTITDSYVLELMEVLGENKDDLYQAAWAVAQKAADFLGNQGEPTLGKIRGDLRRVLG
jgi:hypothetical protein